MKRYLRQTTRSCRTRSVRWALSALGLSLLLSAHAQTAAQQGDEDAKVGQWKTWHLASADEIERSRPRLLARLAS